MCIRDRVCICGVTTVNLIDSKLGSIVPMYKLVQKEFNWNKALKMKDIPNWKDSNMADTFSSDGGWFGPAGASFITYQYQAKVMSGILKGFEKVFSGTGKEFKAEKCDPYVNVYPKGFMDVFNNAYLSKDKAFKFYADRKAFAAEIGFKDYFEIGDEDTKKGWPRPIYPFDYNSADVSNLRSRGLSFGNLDQGKIGRTSIGTMKPRINGVACPFTFNNKEGVYFLIEQDGKKSFVPKWRSDSKDKFNFKDNLDFMIQTAGIILSAPNNFRNTINAFMFDSDAQAGDLSDPAYVKSTVILPNNLDVQFCYNILKNSAVNSFFEITAEEWTATFDRMRKQCPILGMSSGVVYSRKVGGVKKYYRYRGMIEQPKALLEAKPVKDVPKVGKIFLPDIESVEIEISGEYDTKLETAEKGTQDMVQEIEKKVKEEPVIVPIEDPIVNDEIPEQTQEEIINKVTEITGITVENEPETKSFELSETSGNEIEEVDNTPEESDDIRRCKQRLSEVEIEVNGAIPDSTSAVKMLLKKMMNYPHVRTCDEMVNFIFTISGVSQRNPPMTILFWNITEVDPKVLEANGQNPNQKVFEIRFYNDYFDDQKEILLYIPATEIVNNWDQYTLILFDFADWVNSQLAKTLTLNELFEEFAAGIKKRLVGSDGDWTFSLGPSGPSDLGGSGTAEEFEELLMDKNLPYLYLVVRLSHTGGEFYDLVYQSWMLGEKYMMMKLSGTQLNFEVMVNKYSTQDKLNQIFMSIFQMLSENYFSEDRIVSLYAAKVHTYNAMVDITNKLKFNLKRSTIDLPGEDYIDPETGHNTMLQNDNNAFMFSMFAQRIETPFTVRGFVHNKENIPVMNIFFSTEYFQSEYIVPLSRNSLFIENMNGLFKECFRHLILLIKQVQAVESGKLSGDELSKAQEAGRYSLTELSEKVLSMLSTRSVYGCVQSFRISDSELEKDPNTGQPIPGQPKENHKPEKKYKWSMPDQWDPSGELLILKSNRKFAGAQTACEQGEMKNPVLIHLYPTYLDEVEGYALTVNDISSDGASEVKTTYHFVKYQDYAHMRVFEDFIEQTLNKLFGTVAKGGEELL